MLRWLKPVSTLERNVLIRTVDTTLYHLTGMLWYHIKHQLLLKKIRSLLWRNKLPRQRESLPKIPHILALAAHISKTVLCLKWNQHARMKLTAKFKKNLWSGFRGTLNNWQVKVALNPLHMKFLNFAESFILACCWSLLCNKKLGSRSSFFRYEQPKPNIGCFRKAFLLPW